MTCAQTRPNKEQDKPKFEVSVSEAATGKKAEHLIKEAERRSEIGRKFTEGDRKCRRLINDRKLKEAEPVCKAVLPLADQLEDEGELARMGAYESVGHVMLGQKRYREALEYYSRALDLGQPKLTEKDAELARLYGNLAMAQHMLGNLDKALELYRKSEEIYHRAYTTFGDGYTDEWIERTRQSYLNDLKMILKYHLIAAKDAGATSEVEEIEKLIKSLP